MDKADVILAYDILKAGLLDAEFYQYQNPGRTFSSPADMALHYVRYGEQDGLAPSGLFDPRYYLNANPDLKGIDSPIRHFIECGNGEGRPSSLALLLIRENLDEVAVDEGLIPAPLADPDDPEYPTSLAFALSTIDRDMRYFSRKFYLLRHPDIDGLPIDPFYHYLKYGLDEGRATNMSQFDRVHVNAERLRAGLPFILIGVHESSTTGAPIVGLELALAMKAEYNVVFVTLGEGPLLEIARREFPVVMVGSLSDDDNRFFVDLIEQQYPIEDAIFSSSACVSFIRPLASLNCRITCLVHEFLEYMIYTRSIIYVCDLLIFSSKQLLKSWQYMLDDLDRDPATVMVLPQPASPGNQRTMSRDEARQAITEATGLDLEGATLVLGAGLVQIRKGTDIFLQVGNQLKREPGKYVSVWIGQQASEFDISFGVWFHAQIERSRDRAGELAVHFEPAGPLYPVLMDAADVFLVTSRLDPLPNVALDAAARCVPVIAFAGATGLGDLAERGEIDLTEVQIGAIDEMVAAIKLRTQGPPLLRSKAAANAG